jgi:hypothetical protein
MADRPPITSVTPVGRDDSVGVRGKNVSQVLDGSLREAVDKVGGELFTIVHR